MKPWCDRPLCTRTYAHDHADRVSVTPDRSPGEPEAVEEREPAEPENGTEPQERSKRPGRERTPTACEPEARDDGGASPEAGDRPDVSRWALRWRELDSELTAALELAERLRAKRRAQIAAMHQAGMSYRAIGEVCGISGQRAGQIVKGK